MRELDSIFQTLAASPFRARFKLNSKDRAYLDKQGMEVIGRHAREFIAQRLAPACPPNDGRQTPMRGHPVFVAQHATATCCRKCLAKWYGIPVARELTEAECSLVERAIRRWLTQAPG